MSPALKRASKEVEAMTRVCVVLADGFEEIEAVTIVDVLRRAGIDVTLAGVAGDRVRGAHGIEVRADTTLDALPEVPWDAVVLPGGLPNATTLRDTPAVLDLLRVQASAERRVAAICAAPIALGKAGVLEGRRATCYPGFEGELTGARTEVAPVVRDGLVTTSRGPGTAMAFALALVEDLAGAERAAQLREQMLVA